MTQHRVTIGEIAREAGVSAPTVSKVLNGRGDIAAETRDRIEVLLEQHNYRRRVAKRAKQVGLIDLVINELDSPWAMEIVRGVEQVAHDAGVGVVICAIHGRSSDTRRWLHNLTARRSDGVVLVVSDLDQAQRGRLDELGVPLVMIDPIGDPDPGIFSVGATNYAGGVTATEHLLALGHRRIAMITGPRELTCSRARLDGYRTALEQAGIEFDPALVRYGDFHHVSAHAQAAELFSAGVRPTAVFAASDQQAFGVYDGLREVGLRVPVDVSVVGFDDLPVCEWVSPRLTTIRQPLLDMAQLATETLMAAVAGRAPATGRVELSTSLVVRDSTAPPGAAGLPARASRRSRPGRGGQAES